ncbi:O-acetyl-ADP-ribose deacetylase (regulator of RNase III) [Angulomicrobium tetraedrale]|uniref:O-acetyl-ADP-ribose deacetylase (Regulator of RNase III) n=1 Tax=Ancylobacter tetraedralis TaxID=217068 RepID=A0A839ZEG1_9HYPH|nr:macro domain-containing protein [Ancylobacter tetraedralis]MBB3773270.1 O-acetyl-ADP-ribose deacetylase (regulator of RNase III) [Ancylobacter tetraedralis]
MAKIYEVEGDILLTGAEAIAHGVAPGDHFDTGLALALRERFPSLAKDFRHYAHLEHPKPGTIWAWGGVSVEGHAVRIVSLLTQEPAENATGRPGRATVENVGHALRALARHAKAEGLTSLALPRLATGVGGLDWADVKPLVERHLGELGIPVYVYVVYHAQVKAKEPGLTAAV